MCTFKSEREVMVCDVAIGAVRAELEADLGDAVRYTVIDGAGTLVEGRADLDGRQFRKLVEIGIAAASPNVAPGRSRPEKMRETNQESRLVDRRRARRR